MKILTRTAAAVLAAVTAAAVWAVPAAAAASVQGISSTSCIADNANPDSDGGQLPKRAVQ